MTTRSRPSRSLRFACGLCRLPDSPRVPLFEVLERPSAWDRTLRRNVDGDKSELTRFRREFWTDYAEQYPKDGISAGYSASSFWIQIKSAELNLAPYVAKRAVGVWLRGGRDESPEAVRKRIQRWEQGLRELGVEIGAATSWGSFANSRYETDATNRDNWTAMADWLHRTINDYRSVLENPPAPPSGDLPHG